MIAAVALLRLLETIPDRTAMIGGAALLAGGTLAAAAFPSYPWLVALWFVLGSRANRTIQNALWLCLTRINERLDCLTDALIDRLVDSYAFLERKETLKSRLRTAGAA